jgi:ABC-type uncharacterized transport system substrate-binding protein
MPMPAIYPTRNFVGAGGPMNYGANNSEAYRQAAAYAGWILKGEKPGQPASFAGHQGQAGL